MNFDVINEHGDKIHCDVIGMFSHDDKNFIIYTDNEIVDNEKEVLASLYRLEGNNVILLPITEDRDWDLVDNYLEGM